MAVNTEALERFVDRIEIKRDERAIINTRQAQHDIRDEYRRALGLFVDTPLGEAAMDRADSDAAEWPEPVHAPARKRGRRSKPVLFNQEHPQGTA